MKIVYILPLLIICLSCTDKQQATAESKAVKVVEHKIIKPAFQSIIDTANIKGAILLYDLQADQYFSNDFTWAKKGQLPASTFKIPNSIIALETGVVEDEQKVFKWNGEPRALKNWEQDLIFKDAFHFSCVPCYQEVAREIGWKRMTNYLNTFNYGLIKVDTVTIDNFWLQGDSRISQFQQIDFLRRFYQSELPISKRTEKIMKEMMVIKQNEQYTLSGKTGWSIRNRENNGWFVGYIQTKNKVYFFATNVEPQEGFNMDMFPIIRKEVTFKALAHMQIIK